MAKQPEQPAANDPRRTVAAIVKVLNWTRGPLFLFVGGLLFLIGQGDWRIQLFGVVFLMGAGYMIGQTVREWQKQRETLKEVARKLEKKERKKAARANRAASDSDTETAERDS